MYKLSFVIPVFNEEDSIPHLYKAIKKVVDEQGYNYEIVFIDDGSSDKSLEIMENLNKDDKNVKVVVFEKNCGQSAAFDAGFKNATGEYVVTLDADLQNDPADVPKMLEYINDYDVVCGFRAKRQDNFIRRIGSKVGNFIRNKLTNDNIIDTGCSLKIFKKEYIDKIKMFKGMHRFLPTLLKLEGARIYQIEVNHYPRKYGESKYGLGIKKRAFVGFLDLLAVRWMIKRHINYKIKITL
jgi:glycosyltransferase involved in cell wall biosynthesis